jgi:hypothetical protein
MSNPNPFRAIIFSKDRAMQLDALLRSYHRYCQDAEIVDLTVLYFTSDDRHARQYKTLQENHPHIHFIAQNNFRQDVINILGGHPTGNWLEKALQLLSSMNSGRNHRRFIHRRLWRWMAEKWLWPLTWNFNSIFIKQDKTAIILFMVDDNLFTREFSVTQVVGALNANPNAIGFSLRLGTNTTFAYMHNVVQSVPDLKHISKEIARYDWTLAEYDFGYPLEISSSIYSARLIHFLLALKDFDNPNELESDFAASAKDFMQKFPMLLCYETSVAFSNPVNIVQSTYQKNRARQIYHYTVDELADKFDSGERIDLSFLDGFVSKSCHQEVSLSFLPPPEISK